MSIANSIKTPDPDQDSRKLYFRLLAYVKPYWKIFGFAIVAMVIFSATQASIPAFMKPLLDGTFVEKDETYLFWAPIVTIVLFMVRGTASFISQVAFQWVATHVVFDLQQLIFQRYMQLPSKYYDNQNSGTLISKVIYDTGQVTSSATTTLIILVRDSVMAIGLIGYVFYLNWKLSLTLFLLLPIIYVLLTYLAKRLRMLNRKLQHQYGDLTQILEESIKGNKVVKIYGGQEYEVSRFHDSSNWLRRIQMKVKVASFVSFPIIETAIDFGSDVCSRIG